MRPITYLFDDTGFLANASNEVRDAVRDVVMMTENTKLDNEPIVLDALPGLAPGDDFMDALIAMLTDLDVVLTTSALVGNRTDVAATLAEPLPRAILNLAGLRRFHGAFDGDYSWDSDDHGLLVEWINGDELVRLHVPDPREGTDFTLVAKGTFGNLEWSSYLDLSGDF